MLLLNMIEFNTYIIIIIKSIIRVRYKNNSKKYAIIFLEAIEKF